ncbi:MAG TPA: MgtC/SapB family protein [Chitinophaga sp.]
MLSTYEIILRLFLSAILGGLIGMDREKLEWAAGLRTHMLVCLGSALAMIVSSFGFDDILGQEGVILDPSRIASLVISGIGFIGAGTILFRKRKAIYGLTTAAGLWTVAAIGLAVGGGMYVAAIAATLITLLVLIGVKKIETRFFSNDKKDLSIRIHFQHAALSVKTVSQLLEEHGVPLGEITLIQHEKERADELEIVLSKSAEQKKIMAAIDELRALDGILQVNFAMM